MRRHNAFYLSLMMIALVAIVTVFTVAADDSDADTFTVDGITYEPVSATQVAVVGLTGDVSTDMVIPDSFEYSSTTWEVTEVGNGAVLADWNSVYIQSVTVGNNVTDIGQLAFGGCDTLTHVSLGNSVQYIGASAFIGCTLLISVTGGDAIISICDSAFQGDTVLEDISFGSNVDFIGRNAFYNCTSFTSVDLFRCTNHLNIGERAFGGCSSVEYLVLPDDVVSIDDNAFEGMNELRMVAVGSSSDWNTTNIKSTIFTGFSFYDSSNNIVAFNSSAFADHTYVLQAYAIMHEATVYQIGTPNSADVIAAYNPYDLGELIVYGRGMMSDYSLGSSPFASNYFTTATIMKGVTSVGASAFYQSHVSHVSFPSTITSIGDCAFACCTYLEEIDLSAASATIGESAFDMGLGGINDNNVTEIYLGGTTSISRWSFRGCGYGSTEGVTELTIPSTVQSIGDNAFSNMHNISSLMIENNSNWGPAHISSSAFVGIVFNVGDGFFYESSGCLYEGSGSVLDLKTMTFLVGKNVSADMIASFDVSTGHLSFIGTGEMMDWDDDNRAPWYAYADSTISGISSISSLSLDVPDIGDYAFLDCTHITELTFPEDIVTVGHNVFLRCSGICTITIEKNSDWNQTNISQDCFPDSLFYFYNSTGLITIFQYSGCTYELEDEGRYYLTDMRFDNLGDMGSTAIHADLDLINGILTFTGSGSMKDWTDVDLPEWSDTHFIDYIRMVILDKSICSVGSYAFFKCFYLTYINTNTMAWIGERSFEGCYVLTEMDLSNTCSVGAYAFINSGLTSLTIGGHLTSLADYAFTGCNLEYVKVNSDSDWTTAVHSNTFDDIFWSDYGVEIKPIESTFPGHTYEGKNNTLGCVYSYAVGKSDVNDVIVTINTYDGSTVVSSESNGSMMNFSNPYSVPWNDHRNSIISLTVKDAVKTVGAYSFISCYRLENVTIGKDVTGIDSTAFDDCTSLISIDVSEQNTVWSSDDGVLFNKSKTVLRIYPMKKPGTTYIIPSTVTSTDHNAFASAFYLTKIDASSSGLATSEPKPSVKVPVLRNSYSRRPSLPSQAVRSRDAPASVSLWPIQIRMMSRSWMRIHTAMCIVSMSLRIY